MSRVVDVRLERIKLALVENNHAGARRLRTELFRDIIRDAFESVSDPDCDGWNVCTVDVELMHAADSLGIRDEDE